MAKIRWNDERHPLPDIVSFRHLLVCCRGDNRESVIILPWRPYDTKRENITGWILDKIRLIVFLAVSSVRLEEALYVQQTAIFADRIFVRCFFEYIIITGVECVGILIRCSFILYPKRYQFPTGWNNFINISV